MITKFKVTTVIIDVGSYWEILKEFKNCAITTGAQTKPIQCLPLDQIAVRIKEPQYTSKRKI